MEAGIIIAGGTLLLALGLTLIKGTKTYMDTRVDMKCNENFKQVEQDIAAIRINVAETSVAVGKVSDLEKAIGNGLAARLRRVETMTAEMHGWMQAQNGSRE